MTATALKSAVISACGTYRYRLERDMQCAGIVIAGIMVNPSTADGDNDDATIRKWYGFGKRLGASKIIIGNKFAYRSTDVTALRSAADPVGPENDRHLEQIMRDADLHIVAWGPLGKLPKHLRNRWRDITAIAARLDCPLFCLGVAQDGHPRHPLMLGYATEVCEWPIISPQKRSAGDTASEGGGQ